MTFQEFTDKYQKVRVEEYQNNVLEKVPNPIVSCRVSTYQHAPYIKQCLDGILMQKTNFPFEIVIGEDESSDGTREICIDYANKYPNVIRLFLHKRENNVLVHGRPSSFFQGTYTIFKLRGKYQAICEGDDFWTDPLKLQNQVDFLENNKDFSICFTDYKVFDESKRKFNYPDLKYKYKNKSVFYRNDIILSNFIPTTTVMFKTRKEVFSKLDPSLYPGDWFLHVLNSEYGKIKFLPFESTVYRKHDGGVCSASNPIDNNMKYLKSIKIFRKLYSKKYSVQVLFNIMVIKMRLQNLKFKIFR
jgi:glycosyltransferase involved in cell wall biosynthesis